MKQELIQVAVSLRSAIDSLPASLEKEVLRELFYGTILGNVSGQNRLIISAENGKPFCHIVGSETAIAAMISYFYDTDRGFRDLIQKSVSINNAKNQNDEKPFSVFTPVTEI